MAEKVEKTRVVFTYQAPDAEDVFLAGSFNGWNMAANPLKKNKEGLWSTALNLFPGHYEYRFVVDGRWEDDPACARRHLNRYGDYDSVLRVE